MVRKKPTWNEITDSPYLIPIQHCSGGTLLRADIGYCRSEFVDRSIPVVTPKLVSRIIRFAIASGWEYDKQGCSPLELDCSNLLDPDMSSRLDCFEIKLSKV